MKTKTAEEILKENVLSFTPSKEAEEAGFDKVDSDNFEETVRLGLLAPILNAMEEYKNQFSQLPASVPSDKEINDMADLMSLNEEERRVCWEYIKNLRKSNHPPVMGEGWVSVETETPRLNADNSWRECLTINANGKCGVFYYDAEYNRFATPAFYPAITHWKHLPEPPPHQSNT